MEYYEEQFRSDLSDDCRERSDVVAFRGTALENIPELRNPRNIRFGTSGWQPVRKLDFNFSLYFTVLTDMALHCHFPGQHAMFDREALSPKLLGMGFTQRLLPNSVLDEVCFTRAETHHVEQLWRSYGRYFISDWRRSLPSICNVEGNSFLRALLSDPDLRVPVGRKELLFAETDDGGHALPDGLGDCIAPSAWFETVLLEQVAAATAE